MNFKLKIKREKLFTTFKLDARQKCNYMRKNVDNTIMPFQYYMYFLASFLNVKCGNCFAGFLWNEGFWV